MNTLLCQFCSHVVKSPVAPKENTFSATGWAPSLVFSNWKRPNSGMPRMSLSTGACWTASTRSLHRQRQQPEAQRWKTKTDRQQATGNRILFGSTVTVSSTHEKNGINRVLSIVLGAVQLHMLSGTGI